MKKTFILITCLAACLSSSRAADFERKDYGYRGDYIIGGSGFACRVTADQKPQSENINAQNCLYLGTKQRPLPLWVDAKPLLDSLRKPLDIIPEPSGAINYVFEIGPGDPIPYIVVTVTEGRVTSLQVSGTGVDPGFPWASYQGVALGASTDDLKARFGEPFQTGPAGLPDTIYWDYRPWTFSFEIKAERVTSIRISEDP